MTKEELLDRANRDIVSVMMSSSHNAIDTNEQVYRVWLRGFRSALEMTAQKQDDGLVDGTPVIRPREVEELDAVAVAARDSL